jgi:hypothetical protein
VFAAAWPSVLICIELGDIAPIEWRVHLELDSDPGALDAIGAEVRRVSELALKLLEAAAAAWRVAHVREGARQSRGGMVAAHSRSKAIRSGNAKIRSGGRLPGPRRGDGGSGTPNPSRRG